MTTSLSTPPSPARPIRVKLLGKWKPDGDGAGWGNYFPAATGRRWGPCEFTFDRHDRTYDWLVVYDDLPSLAGEHHTLWTEELACPPENTLLILTEPSSVKTYGSAYARQFHWVLGTQEPWALHHPRVIRRQPGLIWFYAYGRPRGHIDALRARVPLDKISFASTVCSSKREGHTLHSRRYDFVQALKRELPELEVYGHGVRPVVEKADALDPFRYHLAIENHLAPHHWTEKLSDAFLGCCMPVYFGCAEAESYFPEGSFLRLPSLDDPAALAETLRRAERDRLWEKSVPAILEARRLVLERYGPVAQLCELIAERHDFSSPAPAPGARAILSRHRLRKRDWWGGLAFALEKTRNRVHGRFTQ